MSNDFECSVAGADRGEPLFATASRVSGWLLIEVRGSWGSDAVHESDLGEHVSKEWEAGLRKRGIRPVCIRSHARRGTEGVHLFTCSVQRPGVEPPALWHCEVASLADVVEVTTGLSSDADPGAGWEHSASPVYLVCTNGRHDQCCANLGRPLVRELRESRWADQVWESSHIGGDRFAANIVALPRSLYFGRVDPEIASALLAGLEGGHLDLERFRGRSSLSITEQAVEYFVRREFEIDEVDGVVVGQRDADGSFEVRAGDRRLAVRVRRHMKLVDTPLTCGGRGNQKIPEFSLESIT